MSQLRKSVSQPQGPAFAAKVEATAAPAKVGSAANTKAAKVRAPRAGATLTPVTVATKTGAKGRCQVIVRSTKTQCQNPANYAGPSGHSTCNTHGVRLAAMTAAALAKVRYAKGVVAYNTSLWGAAKPATTSAAKGTGKPAAKPAKASATA